MSNPLQRRCTLNSVPKVSCFRKLQTTYNDDKGKNVPNNQDPEAVGVGSSSTVKVIALNPGVGGALPNKIMEIQKCRFSSTLEVLVRSHGASRRRGNLGQLHGWDTRGRKKRHQYIYCKYIRKRKSHVLKDTTSKVKKSLCSKSGNIFPNNKVIARKIQSSLAHPSLHKGSS